jgi:hypothetical protein
MTLEKGCRVPYSLQSGHGICKSFQLLELFFITALASL